MTPLPTPIAEHSKLQLHLHDTLASTSRLWVRGRVVLLDVPIAGLPRWRDRWLGRRPVVGELPQVDLHTRILGETLKQELPLSPDGSFEALFPITGPANKRGWRVARHEVRVGERTAKACGVVLTPSVATGSAVVVVLPTAFTRTGDGPRQFSGSEAANQLTPLFRRLRKQQSDATFYYLGVGEGAALQAETALAATALGWPGGHVVLLPATPGFESAALDAGLDRLRWLFAGERELLVLNLEPAADGLLCACSWEKPDRATVRRFVSATGDPARLLDVSAPGLLTLERAARIGGVPRHPVVFCHGMLAMTLLRGRLTEDPNYFSHLRTFLRDRGVHALYPGVEPTGGVAGRAEELRDHIRRWTEEPVNIVAHSMGGLDARFLISRLGFADRVRSLTTIATPHKGTALAEWFVTNYRDRVPLLRGLEALGVNVDGFRDCRPAECRTLNETTPDAANVRYFSYGASVPHDRVTPPLRRGWSLLRPLEGPNDGMVSVRSARHGEYLGTLAVDHFAQTPDALFLHPGEDFDAVGFYSRLVEDLARRGL